MSAIAVDICGLNWRASNAPVVSLAKVILLWNTLRGKVRAFWNRLESAPLGGRIHGTGRAMPT